jgi:hypothetical protein
VVVVVVVGSTVVVVVVVGSTVVVLVVVGAAVVLVVVVGAAVVVVVVRKQHSYACISFHLPTFGLFFLRIKLPATILPDPSNLTKAFKGLELMLPIV